MKFIKCSFMNDVFLPNLIDSLGRNKLVISCFFSKSYLRNVIFDNCILNYSGFKDNNFINTIFEQSNLTSVDFYSCSFCRCMYDNSLFEFTRYFETKKFLIDFKNYNRSNYNKNTVFHCAKIKPGEIDHLSRGGDHPQSFSLYQTFQKSSH